MTFHLIFLKINVIDLVLLFTTKGQQFGDDGGGGGDGDGDVN